MKGTKSSQKKINRNAEDWVSVARQFGEKCVEIQKDATLNLNQKLEMQRVFGDKMAKEIEADPHLKEEDKRQMINSITNYMNEWKMMHDFIQKSSSEGV